MQYKTINSSQRGNKLGFPFSHVGKPRRLLPIVHTCIWNGNRMARMNGATLSGQGPALAEQNKTSLLFWPTVGTCTKQNVGFVLAHCSYKKNKLKLQQLEKLTY